MYATDTTVLLSTDNIDTLFNHINQELILVAAWFYDNRLSINLVKTNYLLFAKSAADSYNITLNNYKLERKCNTKFLGIIIDDKLLRRDHINSLEVKLSCDVALLTVGSYSLLQSYLLTLYYAFFYSHLTYCIQIWSAACTTLCNLTRTLQKRALKKLSLLQNNSTLHIAKECKILLLDDCVKFITCMFMFCVFRNMFPTVITNIFVKLSSIHGYHCTRYHDVNFKMFSCRLNCRRNVIVHKGIVMWNNLPVVKNNYLC